MKVKVKVLERKELQGLPRIERMKMKKSIDSLKRQSRDRLEQFRRVPAVIQTQKENSMM